MHCIVQTPTPNIEKSIQFYSKLGFTQLKTENNTSFSDGKVTIEISENHFARPGLKLYKSDWTVELKALAELCQIVNHDDYKLISCPGSCWIYLISDEKEVEVPSLIEKSALGNFAGMSLETPETKQVFEIFSVLGFKLTNGNHNSPWFTMEEKNGFGISVMAPNNCPHLFLNPSLTYFNGHENKKHIERIRDAGIFPMEEITFFNSEGIVDNISLMEPGGLGFFIFSD